MILSFFLFFFFFPFRRSRCAIMYQMCANLLASRCQFNNRHYYQIMFVVWSLPLWSFLVTKPFSLPHVSSLNTFSRVYS